MLTLRSPADGGDDVAHNVNLMLRQEVDHTLVLAVGHRTEVCVTNFL